MQGGNNSCVLVFTLLNWIPVHLGFRHMLISFIWVHWCVDKCVDTFGLCSFDKVIWTAAICYFHSAKSRHFSRSEQPNMKNWVHFPSLFLQNIILSFIAVEWLPQNAEGFIYSTCLSFVSNTFGRPIDFCCSTDQWRTSTATKLSDCLVTQTFGIG